MADLTRRRPSAGTQPNGISKKRKYEKSKVERESFADNHSSVFPCRYCSAVFVTQLSLSRHVLCFHDAEKEEVKDNDKRNKQEHEDENEETGEDDDGHLVESQLKYDDTGNGYYDNETNYAEGRPDLEISEYVDTEQTLNYDETSDENDSLMRMGVANPVTTDMQENCISNPVDMANVLSQVEQLTAVTTSELIICPLCQNAFGRNELPIHISCDHGGEKFVCPYCSREISRRDHLKRHIKNVHPEKCTKTEIGPFPRNLNVSRAAVSNAPQARPTFQGTQTLQGNMEAQILATTLPISIITPRTQVLEQEDDYEGDLEEDEVLLKSDPAMNPGTDSAEDSMQITVEPNLPFQDLNDYGEDDYNASSFMQDLLNESNSNDSKNENTLTLEYMAYQCSVCSIVFDCKDMLDRHMVNHSEQREHKCNICGKGFLRKEHLRKHFSVHSGMKFKCGFCGTEVSRKDHLLRHTRNVHPKEYNAMYQEAGQELSVEQLQGIQERIIRFAELVQPIVKTFDCDMCAATFVNLPDLNAHQATVHSDARRHKCQFCFKAFKRAEHLKTHEALHTGEREHSCKICGRLFIRKDALQNHMIRMHGIDTKNKPFNCNLCSERFQNRGMLLNHMTNIHGLIVNSPPGLPKTTQQQRSRSLPQNNQNQAKQPSVQKHGLAKPNVSISGGNLGSLQDLIDKGSITLSFCPENSDKSD